MYNVQVVTHDDAYIIVKNADSSYSKLDSKVSALRAMAEHNLSGQIVAGVLDYLTKCGEEQDLVMKLAICGPVAAYHVSIENGHWDAAAAMLPLPAIDVYYAKATDNDDDYDYGAAESLPDLEFEPTEQHTYKGDFVSHSLELNLHKALRGSDFEVEDLLATLPACSAVGVEVELGNRPPHFEATSYESDEFKKWATDQQKAAAEGRP